LVYFSSGNKKDWFIKWISLRVIYATVVMLFFLPAFGYIFLVIFAFIVPHHLYRSVE